MSGMHCSWCKALLPLCECPARLARSLDRERAEAVRKRNDLREALQQIIDITLDTSTDAVDRVHRINKVARAIDDA